MKHPAFDIIVCGSLHLDIMVKAPHLPRLDETAVGSQWAKKCGGKGGNQAVMSARMGARTAMIGRVGRDDFGAQLLGNLDAAAVDRTAVTVDERAGSGMSVAILDENGDYGAVIVSGANLEMTPAQSVKHWEEIGGARVLIMQNEIPEPVNSAMAGAAHQAGAHVVLNAAPARQMSSALLALVDTLVVNRVEAEMLSGLVVQDVGSALKSLPHLGGGDKNIVITLGGAGLVLQAKGGAAEFMAPHKIKVSSSHGAGDCFIGALASRLACGAPLAAACAFANSAAARFVGLSEDARARFSSADLADV